MVRNFIQAAVYNGTLVIPRIENGIYGKVQLRFRVLREILFRMFFNDFFIAFYDVFPVFRSHFRISCIPFLFPGLFKQVFEMVYINAEHHVRKHLDKPAVRIVSKARIAGQSCDSFHGLVVHAEVQYRIHHPRHRKHRAGADGDEQRVLLAAQFFAGFFFQCQKRFFNLRFDCARNFFAVCIIVIACLGCNCETERHRQADVCHFR